MLEPKTISDYEYVNKYGSQYLIDKNKIEETNKIADEMFNEFAKKYPIEDEEYSWCIARDGTIIQISQ